MNVNYIFTIKFIDLLCGNHVKISETKNGIYYIHKIFALMILIMMKYI